MPSPGFHEAVHVYRQDNESESYRRNCEVNENKESTVARFEAVRKIVYIRPALSVQLTFCSVYRLLAFRLLYIQPAMISRPRDPRFSVLLGY